MLDLRDTGVYPYAVHDSTSIICMAWAFRGEEPRIWKPGDPLPVEIIDHLVAGGGFYGWNAGGFERVMWDRCGRRLYQWPRIPDYFWFDTMADASALGLPRSLEKAAEVLGVAHQKDAAGHRLMMQMCQPRKILPSGTPTWWEQTEKLLRLYEYCKQDVRAEMDVAAKVRPLGETERRVYLLDQQINDRGVGVDIELVTASKAAAEDEMERQSALLYDITHGNVDKVTQVGRLKTWIQRQGVEVSSLDKAAMRDLLSDTTLPEEVHRALAIRAEAAKSSVAKLQAMLHVVDRDRLRGLLRYHAAHTGRWGGALVQPQNFPRPHFETDEEIEIVIQRVLDGQSVSLADISSLLRSMLCAAPGSELVAGDFSAIEARVLAWLAGQDDLIAQFRAGVDPYKVMAARLYGVPVEEVTEKQRQHGKAIILGCGFGMGHETFVTSAKDMYGVIVSSEEAQASVKMYRALYPRIPDLWHHLNGAALAAVAEPGKVFKVGPVKFTKRDAFLWVVLPSRRPLAYAAPKIVTHETPWKTKVAAVQVMGVNSFTRKWAPYTLYGGLLAENIVQAVARDLMAHAMLRVEENGYPVVLTVHDEIVTEVPEGTGDLEHFNGLLSRTPSWAEGCPVAAKCWKGRRYRK